MDAHRYSHVAVGVRALDHFHCAGIVDPVAHVILIESSVGNGGSKVVKTGLQIRQIHDEVDGKLIEIFGDLHAGDAVAVRGTDELRQGMRVIAKPDAQGAPK